ncbi:MAG TPA: NUDIX hydrolase [Anaerolineales bacterium]
MNKNGPWEIKSSSTVFKNGFFEVIQDQVLQPDGEPGTYATVNIRPGVSVLPVDDEGYVYLIREFRYALGRDSVEAVAGALRDGEQPEEAARREVLEELGISADEWTSLGQIEEDTALVRSRGYLFLARGLSFGQPRQEKTEEIRTLKMSFEEAVRQVMDGVIVHSPSAVLILKALLTIGD